MSDVKNDLERSVEACLDLAEEKFRETSIECLTSAVTMTQRLDSTRSRRDREGRVHGKADSS